MNAIDRQKVNEVRAGARTDRVYNYVQEELHNVYAEISQSVNDTELTLRKKFLTRWPYYKEIVDGYGVKKAAVYLATERLAESFAISNEDRELVHEMYDMPDNLLHLESYLEWIDQFPEGPDKFFLAEFVVDETVDIAEYDIKRLIKGFTNLRLAKSALRCAERKGSKAGQFYVIDRMEAGV